MAGRSEAPIQREAPSAAETLGMITATLPVVAADLGVISQGIEPRQEQRRDPDGRTRAAAEQEIAAGQDVHVECGGELERSVGDGRSRGFAGGVRRQRSGGRRARLGIALQLGPARHDQLCDGERQQARAPVRRCLRQRHRSRERFARGRIDDLERRNACCGMSAVTCVTVPSGAGSTSVARSSMAAIRCASRASAASHPTMSIETRGRSSPGVP